MVFWPGSKVTAQLHDTASYWAEAWAEPAGYTPVGHGARDNFHLRHTKNEIEF